MSANSSKAISTCSMERRVEGLIVVAQWLFDEGGLLTGLKDRKMPTVVVGRDLSEKSIGSVIVDNEAGGYQAIKHLHEIGHRKIADDPRPRRLSDSDRQWSRSSAICGRTGLNTGYPSG